MQDQTETELKLSLGEEAAERLVASDFWQGLSDQGSASHHSIYFDTPDRRLLRHGFTLRRRRVGNRLEQTLKMNLAADGAANGGSGGSVSRREWTWPVEAPDAPLAHLDSVEPLQAVKGLDLAELAPQCEVTYERQKRGWVENGLAVELALDIGQIRANGHAEAISELELELQHGAPGGLFALAQSVNEVVPVHPFFASKGGRGLSLLEREAKEWHKAKSPRLAADAVLDDVLAVLMGNAMEHLLANLDCARTGAHPEGVHQVRVALRRLRAMLKLLEPVLPQRSAQMLERRLGNLAGALGPVRDLDVFRETVSQASNVIGDEFAAQQLDRIVASMQAEAQAEATRALTSLDFGALMIDLSRWLSLHSWRDQPVSAQSALLFAPATQGLVAPLERLHKKVRKRGKSFERLDAEQRHRLRLAIKKLRYALDLFGSLFDGKQTKAFRKALTHLQDRLGHENDIAVAAQITERIIARRPSAPVVQAAGAVLGALRLQDGNERQATNGDWQEFINRIPPWR